MHAFPMVLTACMLGTGGGGGGGGGRLPVQLVVVSCGISTGIGYSSFDLIMKGRL